MNIEKMFSGLRFSNIKGCTVFDKDDVKIGKLQDAVFKQSDSGMHLSKFTVGGSFIEEMMEDLKLKPDVDPVFPIENIESVSPKTIKLNCSASELKSTTVDEQAITTDEIKLSQLSGIQLVDAKDEKIGNIIDMQFDSSAFQFIVGDGIFKELLEDMGLRSDIDFLISPKYINSVSSNILKLTQDKSNLNLLFKDNLLPDSIRAHNKAIDEFKSGNYVYYPVK